MTMLSPALSLSRVRRGWKALSLAHQFILAAAAVLLAGMLVIGFWVTRQIEESVTRNAAATTALYVDSVIAPLLPEIRSQSFLSPGARQALDETLLRGALGSRLASFKIWLAGGLIAYSSNPELVGKRFEPTDRLKQAWNGDVAAEFDHLEDEENESERGTGIPLLEIYSPVREPWTGEVVAVAEFYENASELKSTLRSIRIESWLVVGLVTLGMLALLFGIVLRGNTLIKQQSKSLELRISDLSRLLLQNEQLRLRIERAASRATTGNEQFLKRISADLHDGPAQLLALASLRLADAVPERETDGSAVRTLLEDAMAEIRSICRGLTLPHIESMKLPELLASVVGAHEHRTGTSVELTLPDTSPILTPAEKICIFRVVQEGLSNAFRHAGGAGQRVTTAAKGNTLDVVVADAGPGYAPDPDRGEGLGLMGLRDRVESLGGRFQVESSGGGTRLSVTLPLASRGAE